LVSADEPKDGREISRRELLWIGTGVGIGIAGASLFVLARDLKPPPSSTPESQPPQKGDFLVFAEGSEKDNVITVDGVPAGGPQVLAWPMDPKTKIVRNGRSLNIVLLIRAGAESWYSATEQPRTASAIAAYSGTCTHLCCDVSDWVADSSSHGFLLCPCHRSHFDPWDGARVLDGPAPRPLPILQITVDTQGRLVLAGGFLTAAGCKG
jgi:rieske iron-sulfur protein